MADYHPFPNPFRRGANDTPPLELGKLGLPVLMACTGRCGKITAVHWPREPNLADVSQELRAVGWVLATAQIAGVMSIVGQFPDAVAPLCGDCARGEQARERFTPGRVPTLKRW